MMDKKRDEEFPDNENLFRNTNVASPFTLLRFIDGYAMDE